MPSPCLQPKTEQTTFHQRYPEFRVWPAASDVLSRGPCQEGGLKRSLWRSLREEALGKALTVAGKPDKERHPDFRLGWIALAQILQEALGCREDPGLLPSRWEMKEQFR